jgi:3'(2'), 5'-bisphosphate nucleotidase
VPSDRDTGSSLLRAWGEHLDELTAIVSRAAAAIVAIDRSDPGTRHKADNSPVTAADEASEAVILDALSRLVPDLPVISEEAVARGHIPALGENFILVDPLDGTREYVAGRDEFTVNVAIVIGRVPLIGIVAAPPLGLIWRGIDGRGAQRLRLRPGSGPAEASEIASIRTRPRPAHGLVAAVSRSHFDPQSQAFLDRLPVGGKIVCGSSVKFCRIAEGQADVYPRLAPTCEWDIAAGHAVLAAAGGAVRGPDGAPLVYGQVENAFHVPGFVAWGDPSG